ncbi:Kelch repeat-containing protein [Nannocystis pusilla]|uniref:Kelch repeat-containing protein n=1 Tax=Nannocystis pusilla TaxID=889268 RepID=UPI003DA48395
MQPNRPRPGLKGIASPRLVLPLLLVGSACAAPPATWQAGPSLLHPRAAHAVVAGDDAIYVLAGTGRDGAPVRAVERYDGERWTVDTELPGRGLNAPAAVILDGRLHLIGGFDTTTNVPRVDVDIYDPPARTWSAGVPLPAPRGGHAAVVLAGRVHVLGGGNSRSTLANHDVYDPVSRTWSARAPLPRPEGSPAAVVLDGKLIAIGGRSGAQDFGAVDIFDPAADAWTPGPPIDPRATVGAAVHCGALHVFGGESQARRQVLANVLRLDPHGAWQPVAPLPTARNFARAVVFRGAVHVVGGSLDVQVSHAPAGSAVVETLACVGTT